MSAVFTFLVTDVAYHGSGRDNIAIARIVDISP